MKTMKYARALYSNTADCSDELTFNEGDLLGILEKVRVRTIQTFIYRLMNRHI